MISFFKWAKDGGPESRVYGFWFVEWKRVCSVALLRFADGSRDVYHEHAFNSVSWLLRGHLVEKTIDGSNPFRHYIHRYTPSFLPIITRRETFHKVSSHGVSWILTFRGPWKNVWNEYDPATGTKTLLTHGRKVVELA